MNRRALLKAGCLVAAAGSNSIVDAAPGVSPKQYFELRIYEMASLDKRKIFNTFLVDVMVPALNRLGVKPVGVFRFDTGDNPNLWVLLPHDTLDSFASLNTRLLADERYLKEGRDILNCPKDDPAYKRVKSSLFLAFDLFPKVNVPPKKDTRIFQMRIYESHNTVMAKRKIEMFNKGSIITLFQRTGIQPVFFGECLVGDQMPRLAYMVTFEDPVAQKNAWSMFWQHPEWKKMQADPYYKDTVSKITNMELRPAPASQI